MGCGSSLPEAETFLIAQPQSDGDSHIISNLPRSLLMDDWSSLTSWAVSTGVGNEGAGPAVTLTISNEAGQAVARLHMPPYASFGIGAHLTDGAGGVVAWLRSPHAERQLPITGPSYCIFATKPQFAGQMPTGPESSYLQATVKAASFGNSCKVTNAAGLTTFLGYGYKAPPPMSFTLKTASEQGIMLSGKTKEKPKRHAIQLADGADAALSICIMYATHLIRGEKQRNS